MSRYAGRMRRMILVLAIAACSSTPPRFAGGALAPLEIKGERLLVSTMMEGQPRVMVLDTGASITSISTATARGLGIQSDGVARINGNMTAGLGVIKKLSIGLADHTNVSVAIVDMPNARDSSVPFDGILGLDVLGNHDLVIDFRSSTVALYPSGAILEHALMPQMARIALSKNAHGLMMLDVTIGDHPPIQAMLDLGAPITVVNPAAAKLLGVSRPMFKVRSMTVGNVQLARRTMLVKDLPAFERAGIADRPAILLGSDMFANRALVIGYRDRVAMLSR